MNIEDLKETAALAHLNRGEAELEAAFPAFEQMLGFFAAMQAADETPVTPRKKVPPEPEPSRSAARPRWVSGCPARMNLFNDTCNFPYFVID
jgi:hypothetical protein